MAKVTLGTARGIVATKKKTSQGGNNSMMKLSSMNKSSKRGYKKYRGQGR